MLGNWLENTGVMPVSSAAMIEMELRDGRIQGKFNAGFYDWSLEDVDGDIVKYRVKPDVNGWIENSGVQPVDDQVEVDTKWEDDRDWLGDTAASWAWDIGAGITHWRLAATEVEQDVEVIVPAVDPNSKETNPKDAIGIKKAPMSVLPMTVLAEVGVGMLEGASKYGRHNWRGCGIRSSVYFDATQRHLMSWWEGEDLDPDSQMSHVTKAICSLMVLRDAMIQGMATDDRPPRSVEFYTDLNKKAAAIVENHADKTPHHWTLNDFE